jgi:hypothetical protein
VRARRQYIKRPESAVVAVQLDLDTKGFTYEKWGGPQTCKRGDWIVRNENAGEVEVYTVDDSTFRRTYKQQSRGLYLKTTPVWAERSESAGAIRTKEGLTHYKPGDYLVYNNEDGTDGYAMTASSFEAMYEPVP